MSLQIDTGTTVLAYIAIFAIGFIIAFLLVLGTNLKNIRLKKKHHLPKGQGFNLDDYTPEAINAELQTIDGSDALSTFHTTKKEL